MKQHEGAGGLCPDSKQQETHLKIYTQGRYAAPYNTSHACLVPQGGQVSLQTLVLAQQSLNAGQVSTKVVRGHQLLLLLDPADGLVHVPVGETSGLQRHFYSDNTLTTI